MINIALVILISSAIFVTFKLFDRFKVDNFQAITINYLVATIFGIIITKDKAAYLQIANADWIPYAIICGIAFIILFFLFALSSQKAGVAITAVFSKMSVLIPVILGIFLYKEQLNSLKILGIIATFLAFILIFYKKEKSKIDIKLIILPVLIFFGNGFIDSMLKYTEFNYINGDNTIFLTTVFFIALIVGIILSIIRYFKNKKQLSLKNFIGGTILGLLNFGTTLFMLKAMALFQSNVLFPIQNVGIVMVSALVGLFFFKEKLTLINWIGVLLSVLAILVITFS